MARLVIVAAVALTLGLGAVAARSSSSAPPVVAFIDSAGAIQLVHPDGGGRERILTDDTEYDLTWSPDSRSLALTGFGGLKIVDVASQAIRRIVHGQVDEATWSSDGRWIALVLQHGESHLGGPPNSPPVRYAVYLVHPDGHALHRVTPWDTDGYRELHWASSSRRLLAIRNARLTVLDLHGRPTLLAGTGSRSTPRAGRRTGSGSHTHARATARSARPRSQGSGSSVPTAPASGG